VLCALVYVAVQQVLRHSANDPQIQLVEDTSQLLSNGESPEKVVPTTTVDLGKSLAPFLIVFDATGEPVHSSGLLHGKMPRLPAGVIDYVRKHREDRVTWQPEPQVRIASIIRSYGGAKPGFVLAGRSLREVEKREAQAATEAALAWAVVLPTSLLLVALGRFFLSGDKQIPRADVAAV
jgi:hypothetical protein